MSRYIDADLIEYHDSFTNDGEYARVAFGDDIDVLPTAEVVEVVRCRECKHEEYCSQNIAKFGKGYDMYEAIHYCSYGERREDGEIH